MLIDARAARHLGLEPIVESQLGGFGTADRGESVASLAREVSIGDLRFEDCLMEVSSRSITPGADGILGADLFEQFRMRVDARAGVLELTPGEAAAPQTSSRAIGLRNLLLVESAVGRKTGWFLVDTGAAYSAVSREMAPAGLGPATEMLGVRGAFQANRLGPLSLAIGARQLLDLAPVAVDLGPLSQREGVEISGVVGFPALNKGPLTIDLRRGQITFE